MVPIQKSADCDCSPTLHRKKGLQNQSFTLWKMEIINLKHYLNESDRGVRVPSPLSTTRKKFSWSPSLGKHNFKMKNTISFAFFHFVSIEHVSISWQASIRWNVLLLIKARLNTVTILSVSILINCYNSGLSCHLKTSKVTWRLSFGSLSQISSL